MVSEKFKPGDEIIKATIPDEDVSGWIEVLKRGGWSDQEIDEYLTKMNKTHEKVKKSRFVEQELEKIKKTIQEKQHRFLTQEEINYLKQGIESRFKEE